MLTDRPEGRQEALGMAGRFEALQAPLTLSCGLMRVFCTVVEVATLAMLHTWQYLALSGAIAGELVGDQHAWDVGTALQELAKEPDRCSLISTTLHKDIQDVAIVIDGSP